MTLLGIFCSISVLGVLCNMVAIGSSVGLSAPIIAAFKQPDSLIILTPQISSWIASLPAMSALPGFLIVTPLMDNCGRKLAHSAMVLPMIAGCLVLYNADDIYFIYFGRFLQGFTIGATVSLGAVCIGEFTSPKHRGVFLNFKPVASSFGVLMTHTLGAFFTWKKTAIIGMIPSVLSFLIISLFWVESPAWLASKGNFEECSKAFRWLHGNHNEAERELEILILTQRKKIEEAKLRKSTFAKDAKTFLMKIVQREFIKPMSLIFSGIVLIDTCGRHTFPVFAVQIMAAFTKNNSQALIFTIIIDLIILTASLLSCILVKCLNRRTLLLSSGISSTILLMIICLCLYFKARGIIEPSNVWLPITLLLTYFVILNLGSTSIPLVLIGELFPLAYRGIGSSLSGATLAFMLMVTMNVTPLMFASWGIHGTFFLYSLCMAVSLGYLCKYLPETKGRTLQEIEEYFQTGRFEEKTPEVSMRMLEIKVPS